MPQRPLSPHLSVYRMFRYTLFTSFANRITGLVLSIGLLVLVYWLMAVASGAAAYTHAIGILSLPIFKLFYAALLLTFSYHLVAGLRHLVWDTGHGFQPKTADTTAWLAIGFAILASVALWGLLAMTGAL